MRIGALVLAAALVAGCGTEEEAVETAAPEGAPAVEDCGSYETGNEPPTSEQETANQCLIDAFEARRPAKLVATLTTVEGDPLPHHFTVREDGTLQLLVDSTRDAYGSGDWEAFTCASLIQQAGRLVWDGCKEAVAPKDLPLTNSKQP